MKKSILLLPLFTLSLGSCDLTPIATFREVEKSEFLEVVRNNAKSFIPEEYLSVKVVIEVLENDITITDNDYKTALCDYFAIPNESEGTQMYNVFSITSYKRDMTVRDDNIKDLLPSSLTENQISYYVDGSLLMARGLRGSIEISYDPESEYTFDYDITEEFELQFNEYNGFMTALQKMNIVGTIIDGEKDVVFAVKVKLAAKFDLSTDPDL